MRSFTDLIVPWIGYLLAQAYCTRTLSEMSHWHMPPFYGSNVIPFTRNVATLRPFAPIIPYLKGVLLSFPSEWALALSNILARWARLILPWANNREFICHALVMLLDIPLSLQRLFCCIVFQACLEKSFSLLHSRLNPHHLAKPGSSACTSPLLIHEKTFLVLTCPHVVPGLRGILATWHVSSGPFVWCEQWCSACGRPKLHNISILKHNSAFLREIARSICVCLSAGGTFALKSGYCKSFFFNKVSIINQTLNAICLDASTELL